MERSRDLQMIRYLPKNSLAAPHLGIKLCTVNVRITAPLEFKRHFDTELVFSLYLKRLLYLLGLGAT